MSVILTFLHYNDVMNQISNTTILKYPMDSNQLLVYLDFTKEAMKRDPNYLKRVECPYPQKLKLILEKALREDVLLLNDLAVDNLFGEGSDPQTLMRELERLYTTITQSVQDLKMAEKDDKAVAAQKTAFTLLERIWAVRQEIANSMSIDVFKRKMLGVIHDVMLPEQRQEIIKRLGIELDGRESTPTVAI
jgi:hypothetical protein